MPEFVRLNDYLKLDREPQPWVIHSLIPVGGLINIFGKPKCFALDTPVLRANGLWTTIGELRLLDDVIGPDGRPTKIVARAPIHTPDVCYRVTFTDGTSIDCDADHMWTVREAGKTDHTQTLTTQQLVDRGVMKPSGRWPKYRWRVDLGRAVQFSNAPESLPLDPYLLGVWLGDGTECNSQITTSDEEIVNEFRRQGWTVTKQSSNPYGWCVELFHQYRVQRGITGKTIPTQYLTAGIADRRALLAGLLDTDGWAGRGVAEFYNTNTNLADGVEFLARSLGYRVSRYVKIGKLNGQLHKPCHVIKIRAHEQVFRLTRKQQRFVVNTECYQVVQSIQRIEPVPMTCVQVEHPSHQFRVGHGLTVANNTGKSFIALDWAFAVAAGKATWFGYEIQKPGPVMYLQIDTPREEWARRNEHGAQMYALDDMPLYIADMWLIPQYPMDILEQTRMNVKWLKDQVEKIQPVLIVIDTLREVHSGDEDNSTVMRNVISEIVGACRPAAVVLVSHARKDQAGFGDVGGDDLMDQARGSSYVAGRMDVIVKVTARRMQFKGRATGQVTENLSQDPLTGWIKIERDDDGSDEMIEALYKEFPKDSVHKQAQRLADRKKYSLSTATRRINKWLEEK